MLTIHINEVKELYDESNNRFYSIPETTLLLEHSLISISLWESKWKKPFFSDSQKTVEETLDYIRCMTVTKNVDPVVYYGLSQSDIDAITKYMEDPMTATTFSNGKGNKVNGKQYGKKKITTSEEIYFQMAQLQIPFSCEKWHINRLFVLLKIGAIKSQPAKKMGKSEIYSRNKSLNDARRRALHTSG